MKEVKKHFKIGTLFGETFNLYSQNFLPLLYPALTFFGGITVLVFLFYPRYMMLGPTMSPSGIFMFVGYLVFGILFLTYNFYQLRISSNFYLSKKESPSELFRLSLKRTFPLLGMSLLFILGTLGAALALIIPVYILMLGWSLSFTVFVIEGKGARASLKRSWSLTKGYKWKLFGIFFVLIIIVYAIMAIVMFLGQHAISGFIAGMVENMEKSDISMISKIVIVFYFLIYSLIYPLFTVFMNVIYYNILKDKEGFATEQLAQEFMA